MDAKPIHVGLIVEPSAAHTGLYLYSLARSYGVGRITVAGETGLTSEQLKESLGECFAKTVFLRNYEELLRNDAPPLVLITLEARHSPKPIRHALDAGCHVLSEKPACVGAEDFKPLVDLAASKNLHLMLALAGRLSPPVLKAKELIDQGYLGKLYGIDAHFLADQTRLKSLAYQQSWFSFKDRAGGGYLIWLGIHFLDLIQFVTGQRIRQVCGFVENVGGEPIEVEDAAVAALKLENGAVGTLQTGYYLDKGYQSLVSIWGSHGWIRFDRLGGTPLEWQSTRPGAPSGTQTFSYTVPAETGYKPFVQVAVDAVRGLAPAPITGMEGLQLLKSIFAFYRACETGVSQQVV
jgi:predicted dehydrogenase